MHFSLGLSATNREDGFQQWLLKSGEIVQLMLSQRTNMEKTY